MITIAEVIEQCAALCDRLNDDLLQTLGIYADGERTAALYLADEIRALAAQYEGWVAVDAQDAARTALSEIEKCR